MKKLLVCVFCLLSCVMIFAQEKKEEQPLRYVDALEFRMINKGFFDTETPYSRLPKYLQDSIRPDLLDR